MENSRPDLPFNPDASEERVPIYTMPDKFLPARSAEKGKTGKGIIIFLYVLIFLVLVGGGLAFWYFFINKSTPPPADTTPIVEMKSDSPDTTVGTETESPQPAVELKFIAKDQSSREEVSSLLIKLDGADAKQADLIQVSSLLPEQISGRASLAVGAIYKIDSAKGQLVFTKPTTFIFSYVEPDDLTTKKENSLRLFEEDQAGSWKELSGTNLDIIANEISIVWSQLPVGRIAILSNLEEEVVPPESEPETNNDELLQTVSPLTMSIDDDNDLLSNQEESLYQSDANLPDTDNDGYLDGAEVVNGYSPVSTSTLLADNLVKEFTDEGLGFKVYYPFSWLASKGSGDGSPVVTFESLQDDFIQVSVADNQLQLSARAWYQNIVPNFDSSELTSLIVAGYEGILSPDLGNFYLAVGDKIFIFTYSSGLKTEVDYLTTFQMIYRSFKRIGVDES